MRDIFDTRITCKECEKEMIPIGLEKSGFKLRAVQCPNCKERVVHPADLEKYKQYDNLKRKTYSVKLRVVGNSHAVSIPKEIVEFIASMNNTLNKEMNEMVKLCFEDFGKLSLSFMDNEHMENYKKAKLRIRRL